MLNLLNYKKGQKGQGYKSGELLNKKTTPPSAYTEATLLKDMENAARFIDNKDLQKLLKQSNGIGTPATRAGIIEKLKGKTGKGMIYLKETKGKLNATPEAISLVDNIKNNGKLVSLLTDVKTTALWEAQLENIANGEDTYDNFYQQQSKYIKDLINEINNNSNFTNLNKGKNMANFTCKDVDCSRDGVLTYRDGKFGKFWACSIRNNEDKLCKNCKIKGDEKKPERVIAEKIEPLQKDGEACPECKVGVLVTRKVSKKGSKAFGKRFLGCNKYPNCNYTEWDGTAT